MSKRLIPKFNNIRDRDAFRLEVCQDFISSGLSKSEFCDKRKVSDSSLYRWLEDFKDSLGSSQSSSPQRNELQKIQKIKKSATNKKLAAKTAFLPVQVKQTQVPAAMSLSIYPKDNSGSLEPRLPISEIVFPNGLRLVISQAITADLLSQLMQAAG